MQCLVAADLFDTHIERCNLMSFEGKMKKVPGTSNTEKTSAVSFNVATD